MAITAGDVLLKLGLDTKSFDKGMKGIGGSLKKHRKAIGVAMLGMATAAIGAAAASVKAFADMGDEVQKMAIRTGFSTEALSELRHAANISGADLGTLEKGVKRMSKTIVDASDGMATYVRAFDRIGLSAEELLKLDPEAQFDKIAMSIANLESPTLRAAAAQDIFGRAGTQLLPLFDQGVEGLAELRKEAHKLGIVFDQEAANKAAELKDALTRLEGAMTGLKFTLARELVPTIEGIIPTLEAWATSLGPIIENTLNWDAAYDKQMRNLEKWRGVEIERLRFHQGLNNTFEESVQVIEDLINIYGEGDETWRAAVKIFREELKAREDLNKEIQEGNKLLEEEIELKEDVLKQIEDAITALNYERSAAGRLNITIDDVISALYLMGKTNEEIADTLVSLGDEQDNVLKVLEVFGLTALEVAEQLGVETDAVDKLSASYEGLGDAAQRAILRQGQVSAAMGGLAVSPETGVAGGIAAIARMAIAKGGILSDIIRNIMDWRGLGLPGDIAPPIATSWAGLRAGGWSEEQVENMKDILARGGADISQFAPMITGGIAMRPMLASIGEQAPRIPEALIPLDKLESMMGGQKVNIYVELDGRVIARALGQPLVKEIRLRTGAHI